MSDLITPSHIPAGATSEGDGIVTGDGPVRVDAFIDFLCPFCRRFELSAGPALSELIADGLISLAHHPTPSGFRRRRPCWSRAQLSGQSRGRSRLRSRRRPASSEVTNRHPGRLVVAKAIGKTGPQAGFRPGVLPFPPRWPALP
jgi:hypothetical protein